MTSASKNHPSLHPQRLFTVHRLSKLPLPGNNMNYLANTYSHFIRSHISRPSAENQPGRACLISIRPIVARPDCWFFAGLSGRARASSRFDRICIYTGSSLRDYSSRVADETRGYITAFAPSRPIWPCRRFFVDESCCAWRVDAAGIIWFLRFISRGAVYRERKRLFCMFHLFEIHLVLDYGRENI